MKGLVGRYREAYKGDRMPTECNKDNGFVKLIL